MKYARCRGEGLLSIYGVTFWPVPTRRAHGIHCGTLLPGEPAFNKSRNWSCSLAVPSPTFHAHNRPVGNSIRAVMNRHLALARNPFIQLPGKNSVTGQSAM